MGRKREAVLVTGASDGVGWHIARHLVERRKYHGVLTTRNPLELTDACQEAGIMDQVTILHGNVSRIEDIERLAQLIDDIYQIRILVNNASGWFEGPLGLMNPIEIQELLDATLGSALLVTRIVSEHMKRWGYGDILFLGATAGTDLRPSLNTAFNTAKWGVRGLAKTLRREYQGTGIRTSLISLGKIHDYLQPPGEAEQTCPIDEVLRVIDFILDTPRGAVVDEILLTPTRREY